MCSDVGWLWVWGTLEIYDIYRVTMRDLILNHKPKTWWLQQVRPFGRYQKMPNWFFFQWWLHKFWSSLVPKSKFYLYQKHGTEVSKRRWMRRRLRHHRWRMYHGSRSPLAQMYFIKRTMFLKKMKFRLRDQTASKLVKSTYTHTHTKKKKFLQFLISTKWPKLL